MEQAKQTEETLAKAEAKAEEVVTKARSQADEALAEAKKTAASYITASEANAAERAALIIKDAQASLNEEREKLRQELRKELAILVADATEKVIDERLDINKDMSLIERALRGISR